MGYESIPGYSDFLPIYDEAVAHFGDGAVFVEVGVALGHSVAYLARKVIDAGHTRTRIYAVDPWAGYERNGEQQEMLAGRKDGDFALFCRNMTEHAPEEFERIKVVRLDSYLACKALGAIEEFDMVLLDGDHSADQVALECNVWPGSMRSRGWLCGDDYRDIYPSVAEGVHRVFPKEGRACGWNADGSPRMVQPVEVLGTQGWSWRVKL